MNSARTVYSTSNKNMTARCLCQRNKRSGQQMGCCLLILNATTGGGGKMIARSKAHSSRAVRIPDTK